MRQFTANVASNREILCKLMHLARQEQTDVEGVVSWLASSGNPEEALATLLK
jgi:hypothetical protein